MRYVCIKGLNHFHVGDEITVYRYQRMVAEDQAHFEEDFSDESFAEQIAHNLQKERHEEEQD